MTSMTSATLHGLLQDHESPCVSLYQPTHRSYPDNQQDPIRYKNLLRAVEASLEKGYPQREVRPLLDELHALADVATFWQHGQAGLAVFGSGDLLRVLKLPRPVPERVVVADSFHVKPLVRMVQSAGRFQVLALGRHEAKVYEGDRDTLDALNLGDMPATITAALGEELTEPQRIVFGRGQAMPHYHGGGTRKDEVDLDAERFFRVIDREVLARFSKPSGLPLILAALGEHHAVFRKVSQNAHLLPNGVTSNPESLTPDQLRAEAWRILEPTYLERLAKLSEDFRTATAHQRGTADLAEAARATIEGRLGMLLVDADKVQPGKIDPADGSIRAADSAHPNVDDCLDDLAELVLRRAGEVVVVPSERMPTTTGLAAIYRF